MSSGLLQLCGDQSQTAFAFRQAESALHFHTFTFIMVILNLVSGFSLRFSGFPPHNGPDEGLAYTDDSVGNSVCPVTGGGVLLVVLVPLILLLGCAAFLFGGGSSAAPVSEEVNAYSAIIQLYAKPR